MRIRVPLAVLAVAMATQLAAAPVIPLDTPDNEVLLEPTSWIVAVDPGAVLADDLTSFATATLLVTGGELQNVYDDVLHGFSVLATELEADALELVAGVLAVVPDTIVRLDDGGPGEEEVLHGPQLVPSGVDRVRASQATPTGAGVTVAVIDSGVDPTHPDLIDRVDPALSTNCVQPGVPQLDGNGHGTHVAGTLAGTDDKKGIVGVAPDASIAAVQVFDALGDSTWAKVICGLDHAAGHAADIDVANLSFGDLLGGAVTACDDGAVTSDLDALHEAICDLADTGVHIVAAAGNNAIDVAGFVPAAFPEVIAVSALIDLDGEPGGAAGCLDPGTNLVCDDTFAWPFSNYGTRIDVIAPGFQILSSVPGGYGLKDGTSMAAPHVAGTVALVLEVADGPLTTATLRTLLQDTGRCPDDSVAGGAACTVGGQWGQDTDGEAEPLVDAAGATAAVSPEPPGAGVHVGDLDAAASAKRNDWSLTVTVWVHDADEAGVNKATVDATASTGEALSCTTNGQGRCNLDLRKIPSGTASVTVSITDVVAGQAYVPDANHDPDGDSDGTTIGVSRP